MLVVAKFTRHKTCLIAVLARCWGDCSTRSDSISAFTFGGVFEGIEWVYPRFGVIGPLIAQK